MLATLFLVAIVGVILGESKTTRRASRFRSPGQWTYDIREMLADRPGHQGYPGFRLRRRRLSEPYRSARIVWEIAPFEGDGETPSWTAIDAVDQAFVEAAYTRYETPRGAT